MKYRLSFFIGCIAVLLSVFFLASCEKKDKDKDGGVTTDSSALVGTWKSVTSDSNSGVTTITIVFNADNTGTYTYQYQSPQDNVYQVFDMKYSYDASTKTGKIIRYHNGESIPSSFKLEWFDKNTVEVYFSDPAHPEDGWKYMGVFDRESNGGGTTPSGDTYSIVGTWEYVETDDYNAVATITILFNADGTGTFTYDYNDPYNNVFIHDVYQTQYTYNQNSCTGVLTRYKEGEAYSTAFKLVWINQNSVTVLFQDPDHPSDEWDNMGTFTRTSSGGGTNPSDNTYSIVGSWKHYEVNKEGTYTEIVTFKTDGTGTWSVTGDGDTTVYTLTYSYNQNTCEGSLMMTYTDPESGEKSFYPMDFKIRWYGANNIVMSTKMEDDSSSEWTDTTFERQ